jgi:hypothetical protein
MKKVIVSQYKASLNMLKEVIMKCPAGLWENNEYENEYWRIVYHTLFYTALYLSPRPEEFKPWKEHKADYNNLGTRTYDNRPIVMDEVYTKSGILEYLRSIFNNCRDSVNNTSLDEQSGFGWLPMSKLELHFYNIRHIQHHNGQLIERLHQNGIKGIKWEAMGRD